MLERAQKLSYRRRSCRMKRHLWERLRSGTKSVESAHMRCIVEDFTFSSLALAWCRPEEAATQASKESKVDRPRLGPNSYIAWLRVLSPTTLTLTRWSRPPPVVTFRSAHQFRTVAPSSCDTAGIQRHMTASSRRCHRRSWQSVNDWRSSSESCASRLVAHAMQWWGNLKRSTIRRHISTCWTGCHLRWLLTTLHVSGSLCRRVRLPQIWSKCLRIKIQTASLQDSPKRKMMLTCTEPEHILGNRRKTVMCVQACAALNQKQWWKGGKRWCCRISQTKKKGRIL